MLVLSKTSARTYKEKNLPKKTYKHAANLLRRVFQVVLECLFQALLLLLYLPMNLIKNSLVPKANWQNCSDF